MASSEDDRGYTASQGSIRTAYLVTYVLVAGPMVAMLYQFQRRSHLHPISGRSPRATVLINVIHLGVITLFVVHNCFLEDFPCWLWYLYRNTWAILTLCFTLARLWYLLFKFELTIEQLTTPSVVLGGGGGGAGDSSGSANNSQRNLLAGVDHGGGGGGGGGAEKVGWYMSHRYLTSLPYLTGLVALTFLLMVAPFALILAADPDLPKLGGTRCEHESSRQYLLLCLVVSVCVIMYLAYRMREVVEGFAIKRELRLLAIVTGIGTAAWTVVSDDTFPVKSLVLMFVLGFIAAATLGYPIYLTYDPTGFAVTAPEDMATMEGLLQHPAGREAFKQHLCKEFSLENLVFIDEVDAFRRDVQELYRMLRQRKKRAQARARRADGGGARYRRADDNDDDDDLYGDDSADDDSFDSAEDEEDDAAAAAAAAGDLDDASASVSISNHGLNMRCWRKALRVVDRHIREGAPYEVNLPYEIRARLVRSIRSARVSIMGRDLGGTDVAVELDGLVNQSGGRRPLAKISSSFFDEAQTSIKKLLRTDSYARFTTTPEYQQLVMEVARSSKMQSSFSRL